MPSLLFSGSFFVLGTNECEKNMSEFSVVQSDCLDFLRSLPDDYADLVMGSPPYEVARSYGIDFNLKGEEWASWMFDVFRESLRVSKGLVVYVVQGQTKDFRWSAVPALLIADLHRACVHLRNPCIYHRSGIPGSGGPDWFRSDYEWCICCAKPGKLQWSDNTACGHAPKWSPGGEMSHMLANGERVNSNKHNKHNRHGIEEQNYKPPTLANPGNVISGKVGGGMMGSDLAHENEAPYPEWLVERFVLSFCPTGGMVVDPFSGSGTTGAVSVNWKRNFHGCDIRQEMVDLSIKRIETVTQSLFD